MIERFQRMLEELSSTRKLFNLTAYIYKWLMLQRNSDWHVAPGVLTAEEVKRSKLLWIKFAQKQEEDILTSSVSGRYGSISNGIYKQYLRMKKTCGS